ATPPPPHPPPPKMTDDQHDTSNPGAPTTNAPTPGQASAPPDPTRPPASPRPPGIDPLDAAALFARGLAMGAADVVPGVSGGTIAFITGIYERFIEALRSITPAPLFELLRARPRQALAALLAIHWGVLIPLGLGIAIAIITLSGLILGAMESQPGPTYAVFFGLIAASAWMPFAKMRQRRARHAIAGIAAAIAAFIFVGLRPDGVSLREVSRDPAPIAALYTGTIRTHADVHAALALVESESTPQGDPMPIALLDRKGVLADGLPDGIPAQRIIRFESYEALTAWYRNDAPTTAPPNTAAPDTAAPTANTTTSSPRAVIVLAEQRANPAWIFCCGVLAISAMVLPGVSGSFLLLFLGQYHAVFGALHASINGVLGILRGQQPDTLATLSGTTLIGDMLFLAAFLAGVTLGLALFARVVSWLLHRAHDLTMAALTGLMVGALRVPWDEMSSAAAAGASWLWIIIAALAGAAIVLALAAAEKLLHRNDTIPA
ncbi:MAG: DUF368 domain-containing protein, partial [Phycisphaerales bacterium]